MMTASGGAFRKSSMRPRSRRRFHMNSAWRCSMIVANLKDESAGNLYAIGDKGKAFGLAQWHPDRQAKFKELFHKDIRNSTRDEQLSFLHWELMNTESDAGKRLTGAKTQEEAAAIFSRF